MYLSVGSSAYSPGVAAFRSKGHFLPVRSMDSSSSQVELILLYVGSTRVLTACFEIKVYSVLHGRQSKNRERTMN